MSRILVIPEIPKELVKYLLVAAGIVILVVYATFALEVGIKEIGLVFFLVLMGAASRIPQRMAPIAFGIELCTLAAVSAALLYGPVVGAIVGVLCIGLSGFYSIEPPQDIIVAAVGMGFLGYFAPTFFGYFGSLGITALALTGLYDLFTSLLYVVLGHTLVGCLRFSALHIPSNYLILKYLGPILIGV